MPRAASLAEVVKQSSGVQPQLIEGSGGVFEVEVDGQLVFSKKALGRFPSDDEILQKLG